MFDVNSMLAHVRARAQLIGTKAALREIEETLHRVKQVVGFGSPQPDFSREYLTTEPVARFRIKDKKI